jgi:hypothetical protein
MLMRKDEIVADIEAQIRKAGSDYHAWRVGIAKDPRGELFIRHEVGDLDDGWICREAYTPDGARAVEDYFVNQCGTEVDPTEADIDGRIVYAYKNSAHANS